MLLWLLEPLALHVLVLIYIGAWVGWDLIELYTLLHVFLHRTGKSQSSPIGLVGIIRSKEKDATTDTSKPRSDLCRTLPKSIKPRFG